MMLKRRDVWFSQALLSFAEVGSIFLTNSFLIAPKAKCPARN